MNIAQTVAASCRYGSEAVAAFPDAEVLWEESERDYQGHAAIIGRLSDGRLFFYEWSYGSCSGCDNWEAANRTPEEITAEMQRLASYFDGPEHLLKWLGNTRATGASARPTADVIEPLLRTATAEPSP